MSLIRIREFLLASYHDLPNILFVGALLIGSLTGYLPLVWVAFGLLLNAASVGLIQTVLGILFPNWNQIFQDNASPACVTGFLQVRSMKEKPGDFPRRSVAPSQWLAATVFFSVFSIYNSIRVAMKDPQEGTSEDKVQERRAFSLSALLAGIVFLLLVLSRLFTGCETILGAALGILVGGGIAIGYWHLLDACGSGRVPDVLQVMGALAPEAKKPEIPVMCVPE
jgi:hypothetical protein